MCSTLTYSSLNSSATFSARIRSWESRREEYILSAAPETFGSFSSCSSTSAITAVGSRLMYLRSFGISPSFCMRSAMCRCSPSSIWCPSEIAIFWQSMMACCAFCVYFSMFISSPLFININILCANCRHDGFGVCHALTIFHIPYSATR